MLGNSLTERGFWAEYFQGKRVLNRGIGGDCISAINVIESDKDYKVEVAAPGMTKEDFNIHISENNELVISMEKKNEIKEDDHHNRRYLRREFSYSKFEQALILPEDVVKEKISANASNGVLTIDLPKRTPEEKAKVNRVIEIH